MTDQARQTSRPAGDAHADLARLERTMQASIALMRRWKRDEKRARYATRSEGAGQEARSEGA